MRQGWTGGEGGVGRRLQGVAGGEAGCLDASAGHLERPPMVADSLEHKIAVGGH